MPSAGLISTKRGLSSWAKAQEIGQTFQCALGDVALEPAFFLVIDRLHDENMRMAAGENLGIVLQDRAHKMIGQRFFADALRSYENQTMVQGVPFVCIQQSFQNVASWPNKKGFCWGGTVTS
jgi:hypothetical protein